MNPWTVTASVQGHCDYLRLRFAEILARNQRLRVVVAYDVRRFEDQNRQYNPHLPNPVLGLTSRDFARFAAEVYAANGVETVLLPPEASRYLATPELSFAIRYYGAQGGLNISASHNPPDDNGAKFYVQHGGQPVPPEDQLMSDCVDRVTAIRRMPFAEAMQQGWIVPYEEEAHRAYLQVNLRQSLVGTARPNELTVIYTPLHGVGAIYRAGIATTTTHPRGAGNPADGAERSVPPSTVGESGSTGSIQRGPAGSATNAAGRTDPSQRSGRGSAWGDGTHPGWRMAVSDGQ
jgi:phosphoglucomutase